MAARARLELMGGFAGEISSRLLATPETDVYVFGVMLDREALINQMAKVIVGESVMDPVPPNAEARRRADEVLARVELFLGVDVEQAKDIVTKVLEEVS